MENGAESGLLLHDMDKISDRGFAGNCVQVQGGPVRGRSSIQVDKDITTLTEATPLCVRDSLLALLSSKFSETQSNLALQLQTVLDAVTHSLDEATMVNTQSTMERKLHGNNAAPDALDAQFKKLGLPDEGRALPNTISDTESKSSPSQTTDSGAGESALVSQHHAHNACADTCNQEAEARNSSELHSSGWWPGPNQEASMPLQAPRRESNASSVGSDMECFEVLPAWMPQMCKRSKGKMRKQDHLQKPSLSCAPASGINIESGDHSGKKPKFILVPHSAARGAWDLSSVVLVLYDLITIPLQFMDPPETSISIGMSWLTRIFWTMDLVISCLTGYVLPTGNVEMRLFRIIVHYIRTWFCLDLIIVSTDWAELAWRGSSSLGYARFGKASRVLRIMRMIRLLRLLRVREVITEIMERIRSERLIVTAHMVQLMTLLVGWSHLTACIWYGIGVQDDVPNSWVAQFFTEADDLGYRYVCALNWALSQLTGGMDEIRPLNTIERSYSLTMYVIAFVMAAVFVSHLTSSMTQLNMMSSKQILQLAALRRFLLENGISELLSIRVQRSAQHAVTQQAQVLSEESVELLQYVTQPLRSELHFELYSPVLTQHPFFARYTVECPHVMRKVCHTAVQMVTFAVGDVVFTEGELPLPPRVYMVCSGSFQYDDSSGVEVAVQTADCIAEATLWTVWRHRGTLTAASGRCRLCALDSGTFQDIAGHFSHSDFDPADYARAFVCELNKFGWSASDLPLRVQVPGPKPVVRRDSLTTVMPWLPNQPRSSISSFSRIGS